MSELLSARYALIAADIAAICLRLGSVLVTEEYFRAFSAGDFPFYLPTFVMP